MLSALVSTRPDWSIFSPFSFLVNAYYMYEAQTGVYKVVIMDYLPKEFLYKKCMCAKSLQSCLTLYDPMDCIKETTSNFIFTSIPRLPGRNHQGDCETEIWNNWLEKVVFSSSKNLDLISVNNKPFY